MAQREILNNKAIENGRTIILWLVSVFRRMFKKKNSVAPWSLILEIWVIETLRYTLLCIINLHIENK